VSRREIAQRWRSLVVLGLIGGLAGGLTLAAIAGARRSATAYDRWRAATAAPDAIVFGTQVGAHGVDYSRVLELPEVVDAGVFELAAVSLTHIDGVGDINLGAVGSLPPGDAHLYRTLARPLLRSGRLPDPTRTDEIVVNIAAARKYHLRLGQHAELLAAKNLSAFYGAPPKVAVKLTATIVGIGDSMMDAIFAPNDAGFIPSGALLARYGNIIQHAPNLVVRLKPGTNVDQFHQRAVRLLRDPQIPPAALANVPVRNLGDDSKRVTHATDLETKGLLLFAFAVAAAGMVLIGQAVARVVYGMADAAPALRALGFSRGDVTAILVAPLALVALITSGATLITAVAVSDRFPVGLARHFEPAIGVHADWPVLVVGTVIVALLVLLTAWLAARRALSTRVRHSRRSQLLTLQSTATLPLALGAGLALEPNRGDGERALPVRPAISGAVVATIGIVAALGLVHGIDDALAQPLRSGQVFDAVVTPDSSNQYRTMPSKLAALPQVGAIAHVRHGTADVAGAGLPLWDMEQIRGRMTFVLLSGRQPGAGEAAIGPSTARALHVRVGSRLRVTGPKTMTLAVSGIALLPESPHSSFDQGLWVTADTMTALFNTATKSTTTDEAFVVHAAPHTTRRALQHALNSVTTNIDTVSLPQDVVYLRNVRSLPIALAIFLVFLAIAALGHALTSAVRRRRRDLAVLRAMGFRPRQSAALIAWLATTVGVIGLAVGIPLGIVAGRLVWRWVADRTPLVYVPPVAVLAIAVIIPVTLLIANLLAAWPARRAARLQTAEVLRTE
jgi:ABC-type lipoprotein release transport system permease subunit